ncbi:PREDICTED: phosphatidylinositol glycan anchor biosynthesis class U protein-like [Priapulus caudatus]|uniref:Phosphatidylinositol glycan anchor biosynthesis class U protein-like n=1 Tax=Priapulus caudatus TaxID=37621 RepID=A0ABM1F2K0_PRICU|nr:PREDICTED: phosphatidylinositol glycan anchor biosynthesis class U protein-like [Priapulus caudatus]
MEEDSDRVTMHVQSLGCHDSNNMTEGIFLYDNGIDPYSGDAFHEQPLFLVGFHFLHKNFREWIPIIFMIVDVLTAVALSSAAVHFGRYLLQRQKLEEHTYAAGTETLLLNERQLRRAVVCTLVIYLFNPYTVASCAGLTTTVFSNFFLAMAFLWTCKGRRVGACLFLSLADYQLFYAKMLIVPCAMMITQVRDSWYHN